MISRVRKTSTWPFLPPLKCHVLLETLRSSCSLNLGARDYRPRKRREFAREMETKRMNRRDDPPEVARNHPTHFPPRGNRSQSPKHSFRSINATKRGVLLDDDVHEGWGTVPSVLQSLPPPHARASEENGTVTDRGQTSMHVSSPRSKSSSGSNGRRAHPQLPRWVGDAGARQ